MINSDESVSDKFRELRNRWEAIAEIDPSYKKISDRLNSLSEEVIDLTSEVSGMDGAPTIELSLTELSERRDTIANLLLKHGLQSHSELDQLVVDWQGALGQSDDIQAEIDKLNKEISQAGFNIID